MRIFISSTTKDLNKHREAVIAAVLRLGHTPVAMEFFNPEDTTAVEKCRREVVRSDLYLGLFAFRYGYTPEGSECSITEHEYRAAKESCVPVIAFLMAEDSVYSGQRDTGPQLDRIMALRAEVMKERVVGFFDSPDDLSAKVTPAIIEADPRRRELVVIGPLPGNTDVGFLNRHAEIARLRELLSQRAIRFVCISGRGGVGKTELLGRLCSDILKGSLRLPGAELPVGVDGVAFIRCGQGYEVTVERLFFKIAQLLGWVRSDRLRRVWQDATLTLAEKLDALLDAMRDGCYLLVLDGLEDILGPNNTIADPDLRFFVDTCLTTQHALRLLVTSRELVSTQKGLPAARVVVLEGLPRADAVRLLRSLDRAHELGLRDISDEELMLAAGRCGFVPRLLERLVGILLTDRTLTLKELLDNERLFDERVVENLIREHYSKLRDEERRVLQGLAVLKEPSAVRDVQDLLAPYVSASDVRASVGRLVCAYLVSRVGSSTVSSPSADPVRPDKTQSVTTEARYGLHPLDQQFAYSTIPDRSRSVWQFFRPPAFDRTALHSRAAALLLGRVRQRGEWRERRDLDGPIAAFWHLLSARRYDRAVRLLAEFDFNCLWQWGYWSEVLELHEALRGNLTNHFHRDLNLGRLILAYWSVGRLDDAHQACGQLVGSISLWARPGNAVAFLGNAGVAYSTIAMFDRAIQCHNRAMAIARLLRNSSGLAANLCDLGVAYRCQGRLREAMERTEEGLKLTEETHDYRVMSNLLSGQGCCNLLQGRTDSARAAYERASVVAGQCFSAIGRYYGLRGQVICALLDGRSEDAVRVCRDLQPLDFPLGRHSTSFLLGIALKAVGVAGEADEALRDAVRRSRRLAELSVRNHDALYVLGAAHLALGNREEALRSYDKALDICAEEGVLGEALLDIQAAARAMLSDDLAAEMTSYLRSRARGADGSQHRF